ncbi:hypothetical protein Bbelb_120130 [Branchiostoma belcheri]|nr:hypothetical protein Bbelb_120130 [Branchiostoma belcheri]
MPGEFFSWREQFAVPKMLCGPTVRGTLRASLPDREGHANVPLYISTPPPARANWERRTGHPSVFQVLTSVLVPGNSLASRLVQGLTANEGLACELALGTVWFPGKYMEQMENQVFTKLVKRPSHHLPPKPGRHQGTVAMAKWFQIVRNRFEGAAVCACAGSLRGTGGRRFSGPYLGNCLVSRAPTKGVKTRGQAERGSNVSRAARVMCADREVGTNCVYKVGKWGRIVALTVCPTSTGNLYFVTSLYQASVSGKVEIE